MIVQQINLYQERFFEKRLWISAGQVTALLLLAIATVAIWSFLLEFGMRQVEQHSREIVASRDRMTAELQVANSELMRMLGDTRLDREIETTARKISARKQVLHFIDGNQLGSGKGFSDYMVALSNLHVDDIWLKQIQLGDGFVHIRGSALEATDIPPYFARFSDEAVFQGSQYDLFKLQRDKEMDWKVDFEIATTGGGE
ncbi:MAG: hypothetical protein GY875_12270 [Gammaproteobacteria bacterium]|nr:hypothetical protein [Gammaproteobacteria bacterium]